jgi:Tfp pilus assembly protein PilO
MKSRAPLIGGLVAVLLAVGFYFLLWQPANEDLEAVRQETAQLETRRSSLENELARLREVEANQVEIRAALARLEEYIPTGTAQAAAVRQFQLAADAAGVEILSVAFGPIALVEEAPATGTPGTALARIPVNMTVEGGYFQAVDFFRRIEVEIPRAIYVGNVQAGEGEDGFPILATDWIGELYAVVPTSAIGAAPAPAPAAPGDEGDDPTDTDEDPQDPTADPEADADGDGDEGDDQP